MKRAVWAAVSLAATGCLTGRTRAEYDNLVHEAASEPPRHEREQRTANEDALAREVRPETVLALALTRNPDLAEVGERTRAALARVPAASRLPDLELKYEQWGVPLASPLSLDQAQM